jgi:endo-1,4-beta-xylanase
MCGAEQLLRRKFDMVIGLQLGTACIWSLRLISACLLISLSSACIPKKKNAPTARVDSPSGAPSGATALPDHTAALALPPLSKTLEPFFQVGAAVEPNQLGTMKDLLTHHFGRLTAENAMKMEQVCRVQTCDFTRADMIASFARDHHMPMTGHALVWHQMVPGWFFRDGRAPASQGLVNERLQAHIFQMVSRYGDVVDNWDVVNEAISDQSDKVYRDGAEGSKWYETWGNEGYIRAAFEYAQKAAEAHDPSVKLYYNDYNVENPLKLRKIIDMVRNLRSQGIRVDGVGTQAHWGLEWPSLAEIERTILALRAENLDVKISELDISVYVKDDHERKVWQSQVANSPDLEERLKERYREIFELFKRNQASLAHVTFWGVSDDKTWLNYWPLRRDNYPLLFDRQHQPKPALRAILGVE